MTAKPAIRAKKKKESKDTTISQMPAKERATARLAKLTDETNVAAIERQPGSKHANGTTAYHSVAPNWIGSEGRVVKQDGSRR
jgi:hypothetical protein